MPGAVVTVLFLIGAILTYGMVIQAIIWFRRSARCKTIIDLPLNAGARSFEIVEPGLHVVKVLGAHRVSVPPDLRINRAGSMLKNAVDQWRPMLQLAGLSGGRRTVDILFFMAAEPGTYSIKIGGINSVRAHASQLRVLGAFSELTPASLALRVSQATSASQRLFSIFLLVVGMNGAGWCTVFLFWPNAFK